VENGEGLNSVQQIRSSTFEEDGKESGYEGSGRREKEQTKLACREQEGKREAPASS